ncbi:NAD(P)H-dependent oxidoreductase [Zhihengliuella sp.]|uniref:NADPH-dependent FMN reductase n=1 Tax=Zhihengliuella sp. TaxID=1954483 RepID=UPI002811B857|nr:NAD(P)H-dependent oxidoreductase [Zhihengliuella sp.]
MTRIAIIAGSTRPNRQARTVADWVLEHAAQRNDADFELVDLADQGLPLLDEPMPPSLGEYTKEHTRAWAERIASFDGFVFVTPEYNHSVPAALKNAVDFLYAEWNNKAIGFVSYGSAGGTRAVEAWRLIAAEVQMADVRAQVFLPFSTDFAENQSFEPSDGATEALGPLFDQVVSWSEALRAVRER